MAPQLLGWFGPVLLRKHVLDGGSGLHHFVFSSFSATENKILPGAISPPWVCIQLVCHVPQSCSHRCFHNPTRALTLEEWGIFQISLCVVTAHREPEKWIRSVYSFQVEKLSMAVSIFVQKPVLCMTSGLNVCWFEQLSLFFLFPFQKPQWEALQRTFLKPKK